MVAHAKTKKLIPKLPCSSVEILCTKDELDILIEHLLEFQKKISNYTDVSTTEKYIHTHYQDNNNLWKPSDCDLVFYVDVS